MQAPHPQFRIEMRFHCPRAEEVLQNIFSASRTARSMRRKNSLGKPSIYRQMHSTKSLTASNPGGIEALRLKQVLDVQQTIHVHTKQRRATLLPVAPNGLRCSVGHQGVAPLFWLLWQQPPGGSPKLLSPLDPLRRTAVGPSSATLVLNEFA